MPALMVQSGKLLTSGGMLTSDQDCCCDDDCPRCCANVTNGAIVDGQVRYFVSNATHSMEVLVTFPSGTNRVCDDDGATIEILFTGTGSPDAYANWDPSWIYQSATPVPTDAHSPATGYAGGYVDWTGKTETEYTLGLEYNACYHGLHTDWGRIRVGGHGLVVDIELEHCPGDPCCEICPPCDPCCYRLQSDEFECVADWYYNPDEEWFYQAFELGDFFVLFTAKLLSESTEPGQVCGDVTAELGIYISARDAATLATFEADEVRIDFEGWSYGGSTPAADNEVTAEDDGYAVWADTTETEYQTELSFECDDGLPAIAMLVKIIPDTVSSSLQFQTCDNPDDCNCCCDHCCGDCHFPITTDPFCLAPMTPPEDIEGTRIVDFETTVTATDPVFCFGTSTTVAYSQVGQSAHNTTCEPKCDGDLSSLCRVSACSFDLRILESCAGSTSFNITITYSTGGNWLIAVGGVGYVYWVTGRTSYSGDCESATASGTFVQAGVTYTWTTSFTVVREGTPEEWPTCPEPAPPE